MTLDRRTLLAGAAATASLVAGTRAMAADEGSSPAVSLAGKSVLITGCSSGFGRLAAELLARQGAYWRLYEAQARQKEAEEQGLTLGTEREVRV